MKLFTNVWKPIAVIVVLALSIFGIVYFTSLRGDKPLNEYRKTEIEIARDSITVLNKKIQAHVIRDSVYQNTINDLKKADNKLEVKETVIKEYHYEKVKYIDRYTPNDITVYFNNRYGSDTISINK